MSFSLDSNSNFRAATPAFKYFLQFKASESLKQLFAGREVEMVEVDSKQGRFLLPMPEYIPLPALPFTREPLPRTEEDELLEEVLNEVIEETLSAERDADLAVELQAASVPIRAPLVIRPIAECPLVEQLAATIARIAAGERFPHVNDGSIFKNHELLLPQKPCGYYREYVHPITEGRDPGRARVIAGAAGELYYTEDHYGSFA